MNGTAAACLVALHAFGWPDLDQWMGIPATCTLADLPGVFTVPQDGWRGSGYVGEEHREISWITVSTSRLPDSVRVWLDGESVVGMDCQLLGRASDLEALAANLGPPITKLDSYFNRLLLHESEWVYPQRGLTLFVNPENLVPLHVYVYPQTTLSEYRRRFRLSLGRLSR
jgi:hypothetical protein